MKPNEQVNLAIQNIQEEGNDEIQSVAQLIVPENYLLNVGQITNEESERLSKSNNQHQIPSINSA